jgi:hypothetical protein
LPFLALVCPAVVQTRQKTGSARSAAFLSRMLQRTSQKPEARSARSPRRSQQGSIIIIIITITIIFRLPRAAFRPPASNREQPVALRSPAMFTPAFQPVVELR